MNWQICGFRSSQREKIDKCMRTTKREIGSEYWSVPVRNEKNSLFPKSTQWFVSGRSALQAIVKELYDCHTVAMPSWCCHTMIKPFVDAGIEVNFYPVYWKSRLIQEVRLDSDALLIMDYFGYTAEIPDLNEYKGIIIRDVTHSIFSTSYIDADFYFGSLRKWCGVWTGGFAWMKDRHFLPMEEIDDGGYTVLRAKAMQLKNCYINGHTDAEGNAITDKGYLKIYGDAEASLENIGIKSAAERDIELAKRIDVEFIRNRRRTNAEILRNFLPDWLIFPELRDTDCPLFVPVFISGGKRDALRHYLIRNDIYCPIHWPISDYHKLDKRERFIYENELSLICDQRYTEEDMCWICECIRAFISGR